MTEKQPSLKINTWKAWPILRALIWLDTQLRNRTHTTSD
jgi:hypothetical protein